MLAEGRDLQCFPSSCCLRDVRVDGQALEEADSEMSSGSAHKARSRQVTGSREQKLLPAPRIASAVAFQPFTRPTIMMSCAAAATSCTLRPTTAGARLRLPAAVAGRTLRLACRAEQPDKPEEQQEQQAQAPPPAAAAPAANAAGQVDMKDQQNALGPVGNFLMASLLIVLCGLSVLSTVGRQFQVRHGAAGMAHTRVCGALATSFTHRCCLRFPCLRCRRTWCL